MPFPPVIDNTMRSAWRKCPTSFRRAFIDNLSPKEESTHLHAGAAFAAGLAEARQHYYWNKDFAAARAAGFRALTTAYGNFVSSHPKKTYERIVDAYFTYLTEYPFDKDFLKPAVLGGKPAIEFSFAIPLPGTVHPDTGDPIAYGGRFDMLADFNEQIVVTDEKTTVALGAQWADQWTLDSQFTGYIWGAREHKIPVTGAIVRGIGIYADEVRIVSVPIHRTPYQIDRWYKQLLKDISAMVDAYILSEYEYALDKHSCAAMGGCAYKQLCLTEPNEVNWLSDYRHRIWTPVLPNPEVEIVQ